MYYVLVVITNPVPYVNVFSVHSLKVAEDIVRQLARQDVKGTIHYDEKLR